MEFNASAVSGQIVGIRRLLEDIASDDSISAKAKEDLNNFLFNISNQLKKSLQGSFVPTMMTAAAVVHGQPLRGGLRGVRVQP